MRTIVSLIVLVSFLLPVRSFGAVIKELDPVEKEFLSAPKSADENQRLKDDFQSNMKKQDTSKPAEKSSGSSWWKWALGIAVIGGIAAAAGGGGGGGSSSSTSSSGGATVTGSW